MLRVGEIEGESIDKVGSSVPFVGVRVGLLVDGVG